MSPGCKSVNLRSGPVLASPICSLTVLCKSNESEFRRISSIVLANFRRYVGEISRGILRRSVRYFEENAAK